MIAIENLTPTPGPFPHLTLVGHWRPGDLDRVRAEFPDAHDPRWRRYSNAQEGKLEGPAEMWGPATRVLFERFAMLGPSLGEAFGIPDLSMETIGGGYHLIPPGGRLAVHTDFNRSGDSGLYRRLNLITYLNDGWDDEGGYLELWDEHGPAEVIPPEFNHTVIFETSDRSWHGHPKPAKRARYSVAAYYFSPEPPPGYVTEHSTIWHPGAP